MKIEKKIGIRNKFTIHVDDIVTGAHREYKAENIVLNAMYTQLVNFQSFFVNIHFGTGTGLFTDATRTSLFTHLGTKAASTEFQTRLLPTSQWRRKIVLNPEEFVGATITEVGVAFGSTSTNLVTHAAIKDAEGNPISLGPKTATQVITIYADVFFGLGAIDAMYGGKIRWVQPLANNELLSYLMGATYPTQQFRVTRAPEFSNGTAPGSHGQSANILVAGWIKDATNKKVTTPVPATTTRLGVSVGNGEIRGFGLGSSDTAGTFRGQFPITGVYTGKAITGENLGSGDGTKVGFNLKWNNPASLVVKADGVAVSALGYDALPVNVGANILQKITPSMEIDDESQQGNLYNIIDASSSTFVTISTGKRVIIDLGAVAGVIRMNKCRLQADAVSVFRYFEVSASNNSDFSGSVVLGSSTIFPPHTWGEITFGPAAYRYYKIRTTQPGNFGLAEVELLTAHDQITFHTPPALGSVITADYTVPYVPKDSNHVLDLQATIQYGEIV